MYDQCTLPTLWSFFPLLRHIYLRESVDIVHGHQATSNTTHECLFHAKTMGISTIYTDHSLFGFGDAGCININKILKCYLADMHHTIAVSHTNKENLVLRAAISPADVYVIPNAVDASRFIPDPSRRAKLPQINIVVISRLCYRKGIDLLVALIPTVSLKYPHVHWIIGGDGPKKLDLEQMIEQFKLHDRVDMLGRVEHDKVRDVLVKGSIFLNCSLTEAFCIAIVEAACCGLAIVSTDVGGVPEVLPPEFIRLAPPKVEELIEAISLSIEVDLSKNDPWKLHETMRQTYSWFDVARRTETVYREALKAPKLTIFDRVIAGKTAGPVMGIVLMMFIVSDYMLLWFMEWLWPDSMIEKFPSFPFSKYRRLTRMKSL
jgi:phosphatidylinositol N-acetylglucosaminyltransferase subunit A